MSKAVVTDEMVHRASVATNVCFCDFHVPEYVIRRALEAALSHGAEAVEPEQKPLIWSNNEARTEEGNLYEVIQMSERVCTTYLNGTAFPRWKPTLDEAKAVAQSDYDTRRASPVRSAQEAVSDLDIQIAYEAWIDRTIGARAPITAFYAGYRAALLPPGGETATPDSGRTE